MYRNYIDGGRHEGADAAANINPSDTGDVIGEHARASARQVEDAIAAADAALARADALEFVVSEVFARRQELVDLLSREDGKPLHEALGEVLRP
ncbi:aldehyde dehydrogenase family protein [Paraburkholderia dipogonis]|nr:aldehyde dehydrogenase family protein [Paraburkholderia dipogonis]